MTAYERLQKRLKSSPKRWLVTGAAGFIGSHLVEALLQLGQEVTALDNFSTGKKENLEAVRAIVGTAAWKRLKFIRGDIQNPAVCARACAGADYVLHQGALGSVPRSIEDPLTTNASNVNGFLQILAAAREAGVKRLVYASSSSVYGDEPKLPKVEDKIGRALSPYAVSKHVDELYAGVFGLCYGFESIGLRYFNVFGPRQDPDGPYAAVIPKWIAALQSGQPVEINGDGKTSRDFCYIGNVVQANLLSATTTRLKTKHEALNVACGERTSLNTLFKVLRDALAEQNPALKKASAVYRPFRAGDVRHSLASIAKAKALLGYEPAYRFADGIRETVSPIA